MSLIPRSSLFDFDNLFDNFWAPTPGGQTPGMTLAPRCDVRELADRYEITAELPGVKKEDLHVTLDDGVLSIEAETRQEDREEKDGRLIRQERRYGRFLRSFTVGRQVMESDIKAEFKDGVLRVSAPKAASGKPAASRIEVR